MDDVVEGKVGDGILAIETSQARGSVAWSAGQSTLSIEALFPVGLVHGREILPKIEELREKAGFERSEIAVVAVSSGPGSFTGARIGVAAGKALAYALGCRLLSISSLETIARNALDMATEPQDVAVVLDARRELLYGARFRRVGNTLERVTADSAVNVADFFAELSPTTLLLGDGARTLPGADAFELLPEPLDMPRASTVITLAREHISALAAGTAPPSEWTDPHTLIPLYLRRTSAEEAKDAKS